METHVPVMLTQHHSIKILQYLCIKHIWIDFGSILAPTWGKQYSCQNLAECPFPFTVMGHHININIGLYLNQLLLLISSAQKEDTIFTVWKDSQTDNYAHLLMFNFCLLTNGRFIHMSMELCSQNKSQCCPVNKIMDLNQGDLNLPLNICIALSEP